MQGAEPRECIINGVSMYCIDLKRFLTICCILSAFSISIVVPAHDGDSDDNRGRYFVMPRGYRDTDGERVKLIKFHQQQIDSLTAQLGAYSVLLKDWSEAGLKKALQTLDVPEVRAVTAFYHSRENSQVQGEIDRIQNAINQHKKFVDTTQSVVQRAAYKGFAGSGGNIIFSDMTPSGLVEGIGAGLAYRTAKVVGDKLEDVIRVHGGDIIDATAGSFFRKVKNNVLAGWYWLFNGSARPYTLEQIALWQNEVKAVILRDLSQYAKSAQGEQSNGFGTRARVQHKMDAALFDDMASDSGALAMPVDPTWAELVQGLARDIDRLTIRLELPKMHYCPLNEADETQMIVDGRADILDIATRLQETLQLLKQHILLPTRALKDLAVGDLKHLLPRVKEEIDQRFELFKSAVAQYHGLAGKQVVASSDSKSPTRSGGRDMYPGMD